MELTRGRLIALALGPDRARLVDTAIPQGVFDGLTETQRNDVAGWYYEPERTPLNGRLLSQSECWTQIRHELRESRLAATMGTREYDLGFVLADWPCLEYHAKRNEIMIFTRAEWQERQDEREAREQLYYPHGRPDYSQPSAAEQHGGDE